VFTFEGLGPSTVLRDLMSSLPMECLDAVLKYNDRQIYSFSSIGEFARHYDVRIYATMY